MFGGCCVSAYCDPAMASRGYQITMNGPCYVDLVDRYLLAHGSKELAAEFYLSVKKATEFTMGLNRGPDRHRQHAQPPGERRWPPWETEWVEWIRWSGIVPHVGGVHMAMARMADRMAEQAGDKPFAAQCGKWIDEGQKSWTGRCGPANITWPSWMRRPAKSDLIFACQLDGQWMVEHHGLPGVFPLNRVATTLATIEQFNIPPTKYGAIDFAKPDGTLLKPGDFRSRRTTSPMISFPRWS